MGTPFTTRVVLKIKKVAREMTETAPEREFRRRWSELNSIDGWLVESEGKWLFDAARSLSMHGNIVEIGSYKGRSTCCLALGCKENAGRVFAIDSFDGGPDLPRHDSYEEFCQTVKHWWLSDCVEPIRGISWEIAKTWNKPIHLLFIDGSHIYEDVMADFASFFPHVVPGGIVAFHDVHESKPGVFKAWNETFKPQLRAIGYEGIIGYGRKPK